MVPPEIKIEVRHRVRKVFAGEMYLAASNDLSVFFRLPREGEVNAFLGSHEMANQVKSEQIKGRSKVVDRVSDQKREVSWDGLIYLDRQNFCWRISLLPDDQFHGAPVEVGIHLPVEILDVMLGALNFQPRP